MPINTHKYFKTNVEAAVAYLIGQGIIKRDAEIVQALGMSKGTFSAYKSGKTEPSRNFVQAFENKYHIKLEDFNLGESSSSSDEDEELSNDSVGEIDRDTMQLKIINNLAEGSSKLSNSQLINAQTLQYLTAIIAKAMGVNINAIDLPTPGAEGSIPIKKQESQAAK